METTQETPQLGTDWAEFSQRHARAASSDFARSVVQYFHSTFQAEARANISHKDLLKKFIDCFSENFEYEYLRRSVQQGNSKVSLISSHKSNATNKIKQTKTVMNPTDVEGRRRMKKYGSSLQKENAFSLCNFSAQFSAVENFRVYHFSYHLNFFSLELIVCGSYQTFHQSSVKWKSVMKNITRDVTFFFILRFIFIDKIYTRRCCLCSARRSLRSHQHNYKLHLVCNSFRLALSESFCLFFSLHS